MASSILNSDDGVISGTAGLKSVGGDDGVLVFQSKGTETARINTDKQIVAAAGTASLPALTTTGDVNTGIFFPAADTIAFAEGGAEAMRINSSGNVGIGTTSPGQRLQVVDTNYNFSLRNDEANFVYLTSKGLSGTTYGGFVFKGIRDSDGAEIERARITSGGNLLVGATAGNNKVLVNDENNRDESTAQFRIGGSGYSAYHFLDGTAYYIGQNSGARSLRIYSNASNAGVNLAAGGTSWGTFSDERLKYDVEPITDGLTKLANVRCVSYRLKDVDAEDSQKKLGVIAQDLVGVVDEVIDITKRSGDETDYMSVRYTELIPVLTKAIQELSAKNDALEARIAALEAVPGNE